MMTDPISDLLTQIKNAYMAEKKTIEVSHSNMRESLVKLLSREGYLGKIEINKKDKVKKTISVEMVYEDKKPRLTEIVRVSKPSKKVYISKNEIPRVLGGLGIVVISSPAGLISGREARKKGIGGELICKIW
ncbi:MAG: 30S ribosomal protein S8 [Patescibacteria group bacterium]|nr:30S ribosomal protein S8 [Patescibacteria group bacterium]